MQDVADKKKEITDDDLLALITDEVNQPVTLWSLLDLQVSFPTPELALCFILCHAVVTALSYSPWLSCFCPGSDLQVSLPAPELALCFLICHAVVTAPAAHSPRLSCSCPGIDHASCLAHTCLYRH